MISTNEGGEMRAGGLSGPANPDADRPVRLFFPRLRGFYERLCPLSYALLRCAFGLTMLSHGLPKLLRSSHGSMGDPLASSTNLITHVLQLPFAPQLALFVALLETFGGVLVAAGFLTRLVAPMMAVQMVFISIVHAPTWAWIDRGIEYPVMLGFIALFISFRGGGPVSIDRLIGKEL